MKVKFICLLIFVSIFLGCGEVEEGDDDTGGKASVINTHPAVGSEIENGSNLTITFDDEDQIEGKHISVSGVLLKVVGNQANWKVEGLSKGEQNSLMVVWTNTDGSNGSHVLVFQGKGKKDDGVVTENWYVPTGGGGNGGGGNIGGGNTNKLQLDELLDLYEDYVVSQERGAPINHPTLDAYTQLLKKIDCKTLECGMSVTQLARSSALADRLIRVRLDP